MICFKKNFTASRFEQVSEKDLTLSINPEWLIWNCDYDNLTLICKLPQDENGKQIEGDIELVGLKIEA